MIYVMSGGAGGLNYKIIAVASESALPTSAAENTVAVITSTPITSYVFSATAPTSPTTGMVWFTTGASSPVGFNAIKKNGLWVYPTNCRQYVSDAWVTNMAKMYQNGAWVDWWNGELYTPGNTWDAITGGWEFQTQGYATATFGKDYIQTSWTRYEGTQGRVITRKKIDVTDWRELYIRKDGYSNVSSIQNGSIGLYDNTIFSPTNPAPIAYAMAVSGASATLDLTGITGSYYVAFAFAGSEYKVYEILLQ